MTHFPPAKDRFAYWKGVSKRSGYRTFHRGRRLRGMLAHVGHLERMGKVPGQGLVNAIRRLFRMVAE